MKLGPNIAFHTPKVSYLPGVFTEKSAAEVDAMLAVSVKEEADLALPKKIEAQLRAARTKNRSSGPEIRPQEITLDSGTNVVAVKIDLAEGTFERHQALRKAVSALLEKEPRVIAVIFSEKAGKSPAPGLAIYTLIANASRPESMKTKKKESPRVQAIQIHGASPKPDIVRLAEGNVLARTLIDAPGNTLTPSALCKAAKLVAKSAGMKHSSFDKEKMRQIGANAFLAVANSTPHPAFIVNLSRRPRKPKLRVALVGKGVCFDTGGYNLKPGRSMRGMHGDMAGAAVALGAANVLSEMDVPVELDCWLGLAENHISPEAIRPGDVVRTHAGKTVEIVDTDAEGRLILADLLSMATKSDRKPDVVITFATLTGTMTYALGKRYSGMFATNDGHAKLALSAGQAAGERLCRFPMDTDYHRGLESKVADILQCSCEPEADHIMAARFLREFVPSGTSWVHIDLSAASCPGGLGAISSDTTGFGVHWATLFVSALVTDGGKSS